MNTEACKPKIHVHLKLEKFDGEFKEGDTPVEIVEREYDFDDLETAEKFVKEMQNGND